MNKHRLTAALVFGLAAHAVLPVLSWIFGSTSIYNNPWHLIASPLSIIFLSGAAWGYLLGHRICQRYAQEIMGWTKSLGIGLVIPALASATLGLIVAIVDYSMVTSPYGPS